VIRDRRVILALLTGLNFLNFIDRAVIAAVLKPMKEDLALSNLEAGLLNSAFLIGYFVTAPLFGARADKAARKGLIALGVAVWSVATVWSGLATGFWTLLCSRALVGVGEASYTALAPTIIDDITPADRKGKALAVFYLAIPLGYALGYILGGFIAHRLGDTHPDWRAAFLVTGGPGIVLALSCLAIEEPARKLADARARLIDGLRELVDIPLFRRAVLGFCAYTAAIGAFSYWVPNYLLIQFKGTLNDESANFWFGIVLIVAGAIGTYLGGWLGDRGLRKLPSPAEDAPWDAPEHRAGVNVQLRICARGMLIAAPLTTLAFMMGHPVGFFALAFVVEIGLFLSTSPINAALMRAVPPERRASAMAAAICAIHLFGDLWSSAALGLLQDVLELRIAMMALPFTFAIAAYVWWPRRREAAGPSSRAGGSGGLPEARVRGAI
jgi:MFS transporter, Spinster family, sphingosine-1-phosphate transporter